MFFTGSPEVGASVASEAGKNLVPVTRTRRQEPGRRRHRCRPHRQGRQLGGRRPAGQRRPAVLCPRLRVRPRGQARRVHRQIDRTLDRQPPTIVDNPQFTATINEKNYNRIVGLIDDAASLGATKRQVIPAGEQLPDAGRRKIAPTILTGVKAGHEDRGDEVFGPVLTVYLYRNLSEAINRIAANPTR